MATTCYIPILGKRLRITKLDSCGNLPAAGTADSQLITDGFISVNLTSEVEDGAEIITKKADGTFCVNEKLPNSFKRFTSEVSLCGVNPSLLAMMTNAETYEGYTVSDIIGITVPEGTIDSAFALELWTGITGAACLPGSAFSGGYFLLPFMQAGVLGDITIDGENAVSFSMTGAYTRGGNQWDTGPYNVLYNGSSVPSPLPTAVDEFDHLLLVETTLAPPVSACSPLPMPPYITSVVPATGAAAGGTAVVITGAGFTGATAVNFDTTPGTSFSVVSDTEIDVTTPAHAAGAVTVTVVKTGGNAVKYSGFTYT